jgi:hypothetical protein
MLFRPDSSSVPRICKHMQKTLLKGGGLRPFRPFRKTRTRIDEETRPERFSTKANADAFFQKQHTFESKDGAFWFLQ